MLWLQQASDDQSSLVTTATKKIVRGNVLMLNVFVWILLKKLKCCFDPSVANCLAQCHSARPVINRSQSLLYIDSFTGAKCLSFTCRLM